MSILDDDIITYERLKRSGWYDVQYPTTVRILRRILSHIKNRIKTGEKILMRFSIMPGALTLTNSICCITLKTNGLFTFWIPYLNFEQEISNMSDISLILHTLNIKLLQRNH